MDWQLARRFRPGVAKGGRCGGLRRGVAAAAVMAGLVAGNLLLASAWSDELGDRGQVDFETPAIGYSEAQPSDAVAQLMQQIERGEVTLAYDRRFGYLPALLEALDVPVSSQLLVFSRTSLQANRISPRSPRAIYFNDEVTVGYVPGARLIELTGLDPDHGTMFYSMEQTPPHATQGRGRFVRANQCLQCHAGRHTIGVPGLMVRSVVPDELGMPIPGQRRFDTDHRSLFEERWGGWYVTGTHGQQRHMGNVIADEDGELDMDAGANVVDLSEYFDTSRYPSPHSDLVALMVLEHQATMHNLITRANYETRLALRDRAVVNELSGLPADTPTEASERRIQRACDALLRYLLFINQEILTDPIEGTSGFAEEFAGQGPRDSRGRSLRDLDLRRWLFRYPCSYMIYSPAFDQLPEEALTYIYRRLWEILNGEDSSGEFRSLSTANRKAILEILLDTKDGLPDYWRQ